MKESIHYLPSYLLDPYDPIKVMVIGAGGTGSRVVEGLARIHFTMLAIGRAQGFYVICIDPQTVSETNVGRQGYYGPDIGLPKAAVLISRTNRSFGTNWTAAKMKFDDKLGVDGANIVISCVDDAETRFQIHNRIMKPERGNEGDRNKTYYWIDFGNTRSTGQVIFSTINGHEPRKSTKYNVVTKLPTVVDMYPNLREMDTFEKQGDSCSLMTSLEQQDLFVNSTLAELGMKMLWELLKNYNTKYRGFYYNGDRMKIEPIPLDYQIQTNAEV